MVLKEEINLIFSFNEKILIFCKWPKNSKPNSEKLFYCIKIAKFFFYVKKLIEICKAFV